ncbi:MAG: CoA pyrophosphatase [Bacteroidia bacterium]|nr:CoA pyrophosphatase [Bacteroidia bacterium]HQV00791.1 CoA pyrophosphatase [Bacteroidia bacterium]
MFNSYINFLENALQKPLPGSDAHKQMMPQGRTLHAPDDARSYRNGAVLLHLFPIDDKPYLLFIKRSDDGKVHGGQIAFPGGKFENTDENLKQTALRESYEEVGLINALVLGALSNLYIPVSTFMVHPFISYSDNEQIWQPNAHEVETVIPISLTELNHNKNKTIKPVIVSSGLQLQVPCYQINQEIIWGATAMITNELLAISKPFFNYSK